MLIVAQPGGVDNIEIFYLLLENFALRPQKACPAREPKLAAPGAKGGYSTRNAPVSESITRPSGSVMRAGTPAGHFASMEKRPSLIVQRTETMPMGVGTSPAA